MIRNLQPPRHPELIVMGRPDRVEELLGRAVLHGHHHDRSCSVDACHCEKDLRMSLLAPGQMAGAIPGADSLVEWVKEQGLALWVEPNCGIGNPWSEGNPLTWEGGAWTFEGDPLTWEGGTRAPSVISVGASAQDAESLFRRQPIFRKIGLTLRDGSRNPDLERYQGAEVLVGVFDTYPTKEPSWLTLHRSPIPVTSPLRGYRPEAAGPDLSDHGLISASLIRAIAPAAEIHLYEVLDRDAHGTLFPLLMALAQFIDYAAAQEKPAVINLSLGRQTYCGSGSPALEALLKKATDLGIVVCAAAGNQASRARKASNLPQAQTPASYPYVIAVAASDLLDQRASYSQRGDIAAPGGEGLDAPGPGDADDVIGEGYSVGDTGYVAMDAGTSFATPLVAGAAALVLGQWKSEGRAFGPETYREVLAVLQKAARRPAEGPETLGNDGLGAGILYLPPIFR